MAMALLKNSVTVGKTSIARPQLPPLAPICRQSLRSVGSVRHGKLRSSAGLEAGLLLRGNGSDERRAVSMATALPVPHSFAFLADLVKLTDFPVRIGLDPTREIIDDRSTWELSEEAIKTFYMAFALVFSWGCCVFGSMNDSFYDGEEYRKAGGDGTGHWIYDAQEREARAAREEMWSEDLQKEIEEKAEEVRKAEEEKEKEVELV